jgi:small subunit ribosomal protein S9
VPAAAPAATRKYHLGTGRRKTAVARIRLLEGGSGKIEINGRTLEQFFTEDKDRLAVTAPLAVVEVGNTLDVFVSVKGGGITGQAGAVCQGIARALKDMFGGAAQPGADGEDGGTGMVKRLRDSGYLTRDGRMKERKKYGHKGARKSFQFSKR